MAPSASTSFWKNFAQTSWEQKPLLAQNFISSVNEITEDQIFLMLVEYSNHCRQIKKAQGFKLYIDNQPQYEEEVLQFLPRKTDKSLAGYHERMEEIFADYCLVCDELLQVSQKSWHKLQQFTEELFCHVGFPNRFVEMGLYLGNYRQTPFGVHVDGCGVFSFPVVGTKTFRLWTPEFAKKNPALDRSHNYDKFKKNSQTLKAKPGDMTYWPSSAWHIAESDGSFSATWSLGVWLDRSHQQNIESDLAALLTSQLGAAGQAKVTASSLLNLSGSELKLPQNYLQSIKKIKSLSETELHDTFLKSWLALSSKQGFKTLPVGYLKKTLSLKSQIQFKSFQKVFWSQLKSRPQTIYAFQGVVIETPPSADLQKLMAALNSGQSCRVGDYLKGPNKNKDLKNLQRLLLAPRRI